jgi:hypothetical protein
VAIGGGWGLRSPGLWPASPSPSWKSHSHRISLRTQGQMGTVSQGTYGPGGCILMFCKSFIFGNTTLHNHSTHFCYASHRQQHSTGPCRWVKNGHDPPWVVSSLQEDQSVLETALCPPQSSSARLKGTHTCSHKPHTCLHNHVCCHTLHLTRTVRAYHTLPKQHPHVCSRVQTH